MSLQRRLALSVSLVLVVSLLIGAVLTYVHVVAKVATEMRAALSVGLHAATNAVDDSEEAIDPSKRLRLVVGDFDGDRHLQVVLRDPKGQVLAQSRLLPPDDPAPEWFYHLVVSTSPQSSLQTAEAFRSVGELTFYADAHNEVSEAWSDLCLTISIMAVFFGLILGMSFLVIRSAIQPLRAFCGALAKIGSGDYATRFAAEVYQELVPVRDGFNEMAIRLETVEAQNRALNEQLLSVQEDERIELARDLHDEVAPFLFAVGADAAMIRQFIANERVDAIQATADSIAEAVRHMQRHVKDILCRLAPGALLNLGLPSAIENLVAFWKMRCPTVTFNLELVEDVIEAPLDVVIFRVVQESFSNAIRHGNPSMLSVRIEKMVGAISVAIEDDGVGFVSGAIANGFGIRGMKERAKAAGGELQIRNRQTGQGVVVKAKFPARASHMKIEAVKSDVFA